jgi:hypothetical protein
MRYRRSERHRPQAARSRRIHLDLEDKQLDERVACDHREGNH